MKLQLVSDDGEVVASKDVQDLPDGYDIDSERDTASRPPELALGWSSDNGWSWLADGRTFGFVAVKKKTQIDMSTMVGQYCEFGTAGDIEMLTAIDDDTGDCRLYNGDATVYSECTPIFGHTYAHVGGECPVPEGFQCELTLRDGTRVSSISNKDVSGIPSIIWGWSGMDVAINPRDVIFIELIKVLEGYKL